MAGDPAVVKSMVFPRREDIGIEHVAAYISEWAEKGLVVRYEVGGMRWLYFPNFRKHQPNMRYSREAPSCIPAPPDDSGVGPDRSNSGVDTINILLEENIRKENINIPDSGVGPDISCSTPRPTADARIKLLIDYFYEAFKKRCGFPPTVNGAAWGKIFKRHLRESDQETVEIVIDAFFEYKQRTRFSVYDFDRSYDNVFGFLKGRLGGKR
jgi:hypothetical protein